MSGVLLRPGGNANVSILKPANGAQVTWRESEDSSAVEHTASNASWLINH